MSLLKLFLFGGELFFLASHQKNTAKRNTFLFAHFFFLVKKKYGAKRNPFLFAYFFFLAKKKYGAERILFF